MPLVSRPRLRDGVDVYIVDDERLVFVFLSTRKRVTVGCKPFLIEALRWMDGTSSVQELRERAVCATGQASAGEELVEFINYLSSRSIVTDAAWTESLPFPTPYSERLSRHMAFLVDMANGSEAALEAQRAIYSAYVAIVGLGGVGSWFCRLLPMMGFRQFLLVDGTPMPPSGIARDALFEHARIGRTRAECGKAEILALDPDAVVRCRSDVVRPKVDLDEIFRSVDVIINAADEPYIGYVNVLLSRYVVARRKILLAAGGFDAHLGCFGELIVPGRTPCADCYSRHFKRELRDWKPINHPVEDRTQGAGGLAALSAYSASQGALSLLRYFLGRRDDSGARAEFLFEDYRIDRFTVNRDPSCPSCGGIAS